MPERKLAPVRLALIAALAIANAGLGLKIFELSQRVETIQSGLGNITGPGHINYLARFSELDNSPVKSRQEFVTVFDNVFDQFNAANLLHDSHPQTFADILNGNYQLRSVEFDTYQIVDHRPLLGRITLTRGLFKGRDYRELQMDVPRIDNPYGDTRIRLRYQFFGEDGILWESRSLLSGNLSMGNEIDDKGWNIIAQEFRLGFNDYARGYNREADSVFRTTPA